MPVLKEDDTSDLLCAHCRTPVFCRARLENDSFRPPSCWAELRVVELKNDMLEEEVPPLVAMILGGLGLPTVPSMVGRFRGLALVVIPESG